MTDRCFAKVNPASSVLRRMSRARSQEGPHFDNPGPRRPAAQPAHAADAPDKPRLRSVTAPLQRAMGRRLVWGLA
jgi:hypothetical protein